MDTTKEIKNEFPLIERLISSQTEYDGQLNQEAYTQSVINLLVKAGQVAKAAGHGNPTNNPFARAKPKDMLVEIESLLSDVTILISHANMLKADGKNNLFSHPSTG